MWQYFYLTAQAHKISKPLLAEMPLSMQDLLGLFHKAKADQVRQSSRRNPHLILTSSLPDPRLILT